MRAVTFSQSCVLIPPAAFHISTSARDTTFPIELRGLWFGLALQDISRGLSKGGVSPVSGWGLASNTACCIQTAGSATSSACFCLFPRLLTEQEKQQLFPSN